MLTHTYKARQLVTSQLVAEWKKQPALFFGAPHTRLDRCSGWSARCYPLGFAKLFHVVVHVRHDANLPVLKIFEDHNNHKAANSWVKTWSRVIPPTLRYLSLITELQERPTTSVSPQSWGWSIFKLCPFFSNAFRMHSNLRFIVLCHSSPGAVAQGTTVNGSITLSAWRSNENCIEMWWNVLWNSGKSLGNSECRKKNCTGVSEAPAGRGSCWTIDADIVGVCLAHSKIDQQQKQNGTKRLTRIVLSNLYIVSVSLQFASPNREQPGPMI